MRSTSVFALLFLCAPVAVTGCSGAGQSAGSLPVASTLDTGTASSATSFATATSVASATPRISSEAAVTAAIAPAGEGPLGPGCIHFFANPICHRLPTSPQVSSHSSAWAALEFQPGRNYVPTFFAKVGSNSYLDPRDGSDPPLGELKSGGASISATIACDATSWSNWVCTDHKVQGKTIKVPADMEPAGNSDHHYSFNDDAGQQEYDFWDVLNMPTGGKLHMGGGGVCAWSGDGTGCSGSNATNIAGSLGSITEADFTRGEATSHSAFGHAITFAALCADPSHVYPATASDGANTNDSSACSGHTGANGRPPEGTRVFLDMSDDQVNAMKLSPYNKAWWRTMDREHDGGLINDTNWYGAPGLSPAYQRDDFSAQAREAGVDPVPYAQIPINLGTIDLAKDMKFCSSGTC